VSDSTSSVALPPTLAAHLRREADRLKTPLYVYEGDGLDRNARAVRTAFPDPWIRLFSLKANGTPGVARRIARSGFGANAVSRGELGLAARAGIPAESSALEGIGKAPRDLRAAVDLAAEGRPLLWVSIESADEAAALGDLAARLLPSRHRLDVLVRVNPDVDPETHEGLAVGRGSSKFGVAPAELPAVIRAGGGARGSLHWRGLHVHVGSQLSSVESWKAAISRATALLAEHAGGLVRFDTLDVGGGFPSGLPGAPGPGAFGRAAREALRSVPRRSRPARLAIEPGRVLVADTGWVVARVLHVRERSTLSGDPERQVVIDAGMTELVRPALYGAEHPIMALSSLGREVGPDTPLDAVTVDGPICESTDRFGRAMLPPLERGDLVAVGMAGAYASAMFSTYNGRPRPPEVMLEPDGSRTLLRGRGPLRSLP
jgi:diaminopimelate decarboxylase